MKKLDTLKRKQMKPKKETLDFILNFSKSIETVKGKQKTFTLSKN